MAELLPESRDTQLNLDSAFRGSSLKINEANIRQIILGYCGGSSSPQMGTIVIWDLPYAALMLLRLKNSP